MKPWNIIGWVVLAAIIVYLGKPFLESYNSYSARAAGREAPAPIVKVTDLRCDTNYDRFNGRISVVNEGPGEVSFARAFVVAGDARVDAMFMPLKIPPGSTAVATWADPTMPTGSCTIETIQDADGRRLRVTG